MIRRTVDNAPVKAKTPLDISLLYTPQPPMGELNTLRDVYDIYTDITAERGGLPSRRDLDPVRFGGLLPHLMLLEVHRDRRRLRVRLAGEVIEAHSGVVSMRGRWIDEVHKDPETADVAYAGVVTSIESGIPRLVENLVRRPDGLPVRYCSLTLPLLRIEGEPEMALVAIQYLGTGRDPHDISSIDRRS